MAITNQMLSDSRLTTSPQTPHAVIFQRTTEWEGVRVGHYRMEPGAMPNRVHKTHEVFVPMHGSVIIEDCPDESATAIRRRSVGDVSVMPAGFSLSARWDVELEFLSVFLTGDFLARATADFRANRNARLVHAYNPQDSLVRSIALALASELDLGMPAGKLYAESLVNTLAVHLLRHYSTESLVADLRFGGLQSNKLRRVSEFIDAHLDRDLTLAELAGEADLSIYHFSRAFKQKTGLSPIQFVSQRRIERAKQLLAASELPLAEIALSVGFKNQSHFTTLFRKLTETTPSAWRSAYAR
ncbi:MAG: AraC family transcriptional regulator [Acidobacteriota bacterium]